MHGDIRSSLRKELRDREYSEGYAESFLNAYVATQIKVIREQRKLTQADLGTAIGTTQAGISRIENVNYSSWSVRTLIKLARAFNVRLRVSFESFGTLPDEVTAFNRESLERVERDKDMGLREPILSPVRQDGILRYAYDVPRRNEIKSIEDHPNFRNNNAGWINGAEGGLNGNLRSAAR